MQELGDVIVSYLNIIEELEMAAHVCSFSHGPSQVHRPFSTDRPVIAGDRIEGTSPLGQLANQVDLCTGVGPGRRTFVASHLYSLSHVFKDRLTVYVELHSNTEYILNIKSGHIVFK